MSRILFAFAALMSAAGASAAEYCAFTESALADAFDAAEASPEGDEIRIGASSILLTNALTFSPQGAPTGALIVSGGWNVGCTSQLKGAQHTKIEAGAAQIFVSLTPDADLTVMDLHFVNVAGVSLSNAVDDPQLTALRISRVAVFNDAFVGDALSLFSPADRIEVDNVLVDAMAGCAVAAATFDDAGELWLRSSTLIARKDPDSDFQGAAICFDGAPNADINAATNTVFNSSDGIDIHVNGRPVLMQGTAYSDIEGCAPCGIPEPLDPQSSDNLVLPMSFDEEAIGPLARFTRVSQSTLLIQDLIDSGSPQNVLFSHDVVGNPRVAGSAMDRGAFEIPTYDSLFGNGFEGS